jgi:hypothetical protein
MSGVFPEFMVLFGQFIKIDAVKECIFDCSPPSSNLRVFFGRIWVFKVQVDSSSNNNIVEFFPVNSPTLSDIIIEGAGLKLGVFVNVRNADFDFLSFKI